MIKLVPDYNLTCRNKLRKQHLLEMAGRLSLNVCSFKEEKSEEIAFFSSEEWNSDTERRFLAKIQEILTVGRSLVSALDLVIKIQTNNPELFLFSIGKLAAKKAEVKPTNLSIREIEVLSLIMQGLTNNEIAEKLFISYETVKSHRKNILEKTGARNTAALIHYYHQAFSDKE